LGFLRKSDENIPSSDIPPAVRNGTVKEWVVSAK
jgi:hypothetical protein